LIVLALMVGVHQGMAQVPVVSSFSQNGMLVCTDLQAGAVATVQWAPTLSGPWQTDWASLSAVTVGTSGTITVSVPMFYRVCQGPSNITTSDGMALIPAGSFTMGDTLDGEGDALPTNIYVSAFYMDTNLMNGAGLWAIIHGLILVGDLDYSFSFSSPTFKNQGPWVTMNWYDCVKLCNARSQVMSLTPVYYTDAGLTQVYTSGQLTPYVNWTANGYRLPTEAEWEKAARGRLIGQRFPWGNTISESQANYCSTNTYGYDSGPSGYNTNFMTGGVPYTSPVGYFAPNEYSLSDMAGNVMEWCWDWYGTPYGQSTTNDPTGPTSGSNRVLRGGSWNSDASSARCAARNHSNPSNACNYVGFRCVRGF